MNNIKKIIIIVFAVLILLILGITVFGAEKSESVPEGYQLIEDIEGARFHMNQKLLDLSTSIIKITKDSNLDGNNFYVYKNGTDEYILFNMNKIVVLVQKGTSFHFEKAEDKEQALKSASVCNIWFEKSGKKLEYEDRNGGIVANVNAQITITKELYGDFTGKLVTVAKEGIEYSIFAGVPGSKYKDISKSDLAIIETIALSLRIAEEQESTTQTEKVLPSDNTPQAVETNQVPVKENTSSVSVSTNTVSDNKPEKEEISVSNNEEEVIEKENTEENDTVTITETVSETNVVEETQAKESETILEVQTPQEEAENEKEEVTEEAAENVSLEKSVVSVNNQKEKEKIGTKYKSDIYSMLKVGEEGYLSAFHSEKLNYELASIQITEVITGSKAIKEIQKNLTDYSYFAPKEGTNYHLIIYNLDYENCNGTPYVNIKLRGLDGEPLKYMGVKYSKKTHDLTTLARVNGTKIENLMCYYEVPNGCKEYVLECGEGTIQSNKNILSAYYRIETE